MGYPKRRPKRDLRAVFRVRPFPGRLRSIGTSDVNAMIQGHLRQAAVTIDRAAAVLLHRAAQDYLAAVACDAHASARWAGRTRMTRRDWLLAGRMHKLRQ